MPAYEPDPSHYQTCSILGSCCGEVGTVHLARHLPSGSLVVVKSYNMDRAREEAALIQQEVVLTRQLQHPNVLPYLAAFVSGPEVQVVSPLMSLGSCRDLIHNHFGQGLPEPAISHILRDVLQGLDYVHRKGYIHRALRASHILVSADGHSCLAGFRYACPIVENGRWKRNVHSFPLTSAPNLNWLSPELLAQNLQGYNEKSDVYSLGVTACELANGAVPFSDVPTTLMLTEKVRGCAPQLLDCSTLPLYEDLHNGEDCNRDEDHYRSMQERRLSEPFHALVELCLQRDPVLRPTAAQLSNHPFLRPARSKGARNLLDMLRPVLPLCERRMDSQDDLATVLATEKLSKLEIEPDQWDF